MTNAQRIANLYEVLKSYAPDDKARKLCQNFVIRNETNDKEIIIELVSSIYDGLAYGNWPWVVAKLKGVSQIEKKKGEA